MVSVAPDHPAYLVSVVCPERRVIVGICAVSIRVERRFIHDQKARAICGAQPFFGPKLVVETEGDCVAGAYLPYLAVNRGVRLRVGDGPGSACQKMAFGPIEIKIWPLGPYLLKSKGLRQRIQNYLPLLQIQFQPIQMRVFRRPVVSVWKRSANVPDAVGDRDARQCQHGLAVLQHAPADCEACFIAVRCPLQGQCPLACRWGYYQIVLNDPILRRRLQSNIIPEAEGVP